jgi:glycosyltransferase involved in cell wall biosynthesis
VKILKISQTYYPFLAEGGRPTKVKAIASRLARQGHRVTVLSADFGLVSRKDSVENLESCQWGWRSESGGVEAIYLRSFVRYRTVTLNPDVIRFCLGNLAHVDVVHIYGLYDLLGPAVAQFCSRRQLPYIVEPMGMYQPIVRSVRLKKLYHHILGARLIRGARFLIATSQQEKHELLASGIKEQRVIIRRNGIDVPASLPESGRFRLDWAIPKQAKLILFLGRINAKKSPEMLIYAFARWRARVGPCTTNFLVIAGPGEEVAYLSRLKDLCKRLSIENVVRFTGPLYDEAKWAAYRDADVFVLPSQNENFGNTAAESAACGTPVIVTDQCGIAPIVDGRAGIVVQHSTEGLEQALSSLLSQPQLREAYEVGCEAVTRELSWDEPVTQMENLAALCVNGAGAMNLWPVADPH